MRMFRKASVGRQGLGGAVTDRPVKTVCRVDRWARLSLVPRGWWRPAGQSLPGSLVSKVKIAAGGAGSVLTARGDSETHGVAHTPTAFTSQGSSCQGPPAT